MPKDELSIKQLAFVNEYMKCMNATQAYMRVYPKSSYEAANANSARLLSNTIVKAEIEKRMKANTMSANEVIAGISSVAFAPDVKTSDRLRAFELLGKFHKLFTDKFEVAGKKVIKVTFKKEE
jgi:phage terminase small subunit